MHLAWFYWILILILALVFAWICAAIADIKDYSGLGFGILGFFSFLVIFIITYNVVLVLPTN
jgi:hypothetical protein